jgi:hypothetical protein
MTHLSRASLEYPEPGAVCLLCPSAVYLYNSITTDDAAAIYINDSSDEDMSEVES